MMVVERRNGGDHTLSRNGTLKIAPVDATEASHLSESSSSQVDIIKLCRRRDLSDHCDGKGGGR